MPGVAVGDHGEDEDFFRDLPAGAVGDSGRTHQIDIERQVRPVLLDRPARDDANFFELDRVVDLGPGQLFVTVFGQRLATSWEFLAG